MQKVTICSSKAFSYYMTQKPDQPTRDRVDLRKAAFSAFMDEFVAESDRAAVVLGAAIEALLCSVLDRYFIAHPGSFWHMRELGLVL